MAEFLMPALGADMVTGKVVEWRVHAGQRVRPGDVVAVVETHKGAIDVECFLDGVIEDLAPLDAELRVGAPLARVRGVDEPPPVQPATVAAGVPAHVATASSAPEPSGRAAAPVAPVTPVVREGRILASPAARQRAQVLGVDLTSVVGHGIDGAVTLADVERSGARAAPPPAARPAAERFDPALMRQSIAAAMARSKREIPHYYLAANVDFGAALAWLANHNAGRSPTEHVLPAALLLKGVARGLAEVPQLNGFYEGGAFRPGAGVHVGWAVNLRGGGLIAPAVHHADRLTLAEAMTALRDLVQRARTGGLRSSELTDPTITVTSLGDRGAESVWGVIVPPQVAIVGIGRVVQRPAVVDGLMVPRPQFALTLAADHRVSDGHLGGRLLEAIDRALQAPAQL